MKAIQIKKHQVAAIEAIKNAINNKQPEITIEMATGTGTSLILAKTLEYLLEIGKKKVLIITGSVSIKEQLNSWIFEHYKDLINIDKHMVDIKNIQYVYKNPNVINDTYHFIITYDIPQSNRCYEILYKSQKTIINFQKYKKKLFPTSDIVFTYSQQDAIKDGIFSPAIDPKLYDIAAESFCKRLLEKFNCKPINDIESVNEAFWDFRFSNEGKTIYVQHKNFKSEDISPNEINTVLKNILWHKSQHKIPQEDITLLILFGNAFGIDRKVLYEKFKIIVWDISNLVFYTQNDESLARELSQLTYFPIEEIAGEPAEAWNFTTISSPDTVEDLSVIADEYINKLKGCKTGQANSREYEEICEDIVRYLFSDAFHYMSSQHRTEDKHFRMDLICSFKGINEKTHAFWQLLAQHYNTRFVVFEFKNYSTTIDQNLIYITEKYLFNPALRNVAIIISRKGFSDSAKFASAGCLKEHGKLILNVTDNDLIQMLEFKKNGGTAATLLMEKFENFVMSISK